MSQIIRADNAPGPIKASSPDYWTHCPHHWRFMVVVAPSGQGRIARSTTRHATPFVRWATWKIKSCSPQLPLSPCGGDGSANERPVAERHHTGVKGVCMGPLSGWKEELPVSPGVAHCKMKISNR